MEENTPARNLKLVIAYNGTAYHGWQRQAAGIDTVQERIETIASRVLGHPVIIRGTSRTDAGVHAEGQVATLRTGNMSVPLIGLRKAINSRLPRDITIRSICAVDSDFDASRHAMSKTYRYRIYVSPQRPVSLCKRVWYYWRPLDVARMQSGAALLTGEHDFAGFASSGDERDSTVRRIYSCNVHSMDNEVVISVRGNGFLYKMVRNITGTLVEIGRGHWSPERVLEILSLADRTMAGPTAPPDGLTLWCIHY